MSGSERVFAKRVAALKQFARFVVVGVVNTGFSYGIYAALLYAGFGYAVANLIALVVGILFSFTTQSRFVFKERGGGRLLRFIGTWVVLYGANIAFIGVFIRMGFNAYVSGALALPLTTILSFAAQKFFVFRPSQPVPDRTIAGTSIPDPQSTSDSDSVTEPREFGDRYASVQLARRASGWRSRIKQFYLDRILRFATGPTVDIGCGAGQLLEQLPAGSIGLEVNPALVRDLRSRGLDVVQIVPVDGVISLGALEAGRVGTAVLSHVLEHFDNAAAVLRRLIDDCRRLDISRLVVIVPGRVGYVSDATHKTFVTPAYLAEHGLLEGAGFEVRHRSFFPGNAAWIGRWFIYHEWMIVYDLSRTVDDRRHEHDRSHRHRPRPSGQAR